MNFEQGYSLPKGTPLGKHLALIQNIKLIIKYRNVYRKNVLAYCAMVLKRFVVQAL
jgi:hypothetical protein